MKNVVLRVNRNLGRRLREARHERGYSTLSVAKIVSKRVPISHATIANYERGESTPPIDVLAALADLYGRPLNWFLETRETLSGFRYRNIKSRVGIKDKRQFEAVAGKWIDAYVGLENRLRKRLVKSIPDITVDQSVSPPKLAGLLREERGISDDSPILNVMDLLELFAVRTMEIDTDLEIDALAARRGDAFVVVLNRRKSADRLRLTACHELAHVLYDDCKNGGDLDDAKVEKRAHEFASHLLLPQSQLREAFRGESFIRLLQFKEKFGISLAAMIYRAEQAKIIRATTARRLWIEMARRGWKKVEPGTVWRDRAIRFEVLMEGAIQSRELTWDDAELATGVRKEELRQRLEAVTDVFDLPNTENHAEVPRVLSIHRV